MMDVDSLLVKAGQLYSKCLDGYSELMPDIVKCRRRVYGQNELLFKTLSLKLLLWAPFFFMRKPPKYIFQGLRHQGLIEALPASEVMVLGGRGEFLYCLKRGCKFHWIGYVSKAFELYYWGGKRGAFLSAVCLIRKMFNAQDGNKRYLFLWEDTLPTGVVLSTVLDSMPKLSIVCVAHGIFPEYKEQAVSPEGESCQFNFVWSSSQQKIFKERRYPSTFVLGLPYEVRVPQKTSRKVVLIGHCGPSSGMTEYLYALYVFRKIFIALYDAGFEVEYRPHPQEPVDFIPEAFPSLCLENKMEMLSSERRLYIGFASTLMYEARQFGNLVVALDTSDLLYQINFEVDAVISPVDYDQVPEIVSRLFDDGYINIDEANYQSLSVRFDGCLKQVDEHATLLSEGGGERLGEV